ncbi:hypothetical protein SAMD00023353_3001210 [Rosellinia necatrix]|uniref:Uncharacterized protein n=1 Tax=Rosellinia necatrix TaxID=77044 RepID=A0A1S8A8M2_ROSNE|nr:hypothetical protein SAMD00023353_3001210 [Rosellinia necatrix]
MSVGPNAIIAIVVIFVIAGLGLVFWQGKRIVSAFAHAMFAGKQAERESGDNEEQPSQRRREAASSESAV